jgi:hypothetical protein
LAAEPIDGHHGTIAVELDDDQRIKVQQKLGKEIGGYSSGEDPYQDENILYDRIRVVCGKGVKLEDCSVHL